MTTTQRPIPSGPSPGEPHLNVSMLAHDMRSALQGVIGGVAVLDRAAFSPTIRAQLDRVSAAAQELARLLNALLGEDAPGRGAASADRVDLGRLSQQIAKRWSGEAEQRGMRLVIDPAADAPTTLNANLGLLSRVLDNLIGNAVRYAGSGELRLRMQRTDEGGLRLQVLDDGPGIPQETIDRVLRPGAKLSETGDGHGLGLHIVRRFSAELGAAFTIGRRPTGGVEATVVFPASVCDRTEAPPFVAPTRGVDLAGVRVLLAEDNPTNQIVATQMLRALQAEVTLTSDGIEAMEKFEAAEFDLVVVDIEMPRMTGLDVIRAIRSRRDGRERTPIVALTAYAMREHRDRIAAAGANGLISKPITSVEALGQALRVHVSRERRVENGFSEDASPRPDEPVADPDVFDALCVAIGSGMMAELLEKVVADLMQARRDLAQALSPLDLKPIRSASHILISVAGAIGANRLQSCARTLNIAAHSEDSRSLPDDARRCLTEIDAAVAFANSRRATV